MDINNAKLYLFVIVVNLQVGRGFQTCDVWFRLITRTTEEVTFGQ